MKGRAKSELRNCRRVGKANSPPMWPHPNSLEPVMIGWNTGIKLADHKRPMSWTWRLCCV